MDGLGFHDGYRGRLCSLSRWIPPLRTAKTIVLMGVSTTRLAMAPAGDAAGLTAYFPSSRVGEHVGRAALAAYRSRAVGPTAAVVRTVDHNSLIRREAVPVSGPLTS